MLYAINIDEETLRSRYLDAYERGLAITAGGRSIPTDLIEQVLVLETPEPMSQIGSEAWTTAWTTGSNRTDDFVTGPPGSLAAESTVLGPGITRDPTRVMIVHGRNTAALNALRAFLHALGLVPVLWEDAIEETGEGSPHNLDAVIAAMSLAQAVVVMFTAEDEARLMARFQDGPTEDDELVGQPRPNVLIEAGMAMALGRERTILTRLGPIREASDLDGLNAVNLANEHGPRTALRRRLATVGCQINDRTDYLESAVAGDFDAAIAP